MANIKALKFLEDNGIPNMPTQFRKECQTSVTDTAEALEAYFVKRLEEIKKID